MNNFSIAHTIVEQTIGVGRIQREYMCKSDSFQEDAVIHPGNSLSLRRYRTLGLPLCVLEVIRGLTGWRRM